MHSTLCCLGGGYEWYCVSLYQLKVKGLFVVLLKLVT